MAKKVSKIEISGHDFGSLMLAFHHWLEHHCPPEAAKAFQSLLQGGEITAKYGKIPVEQLNRKQVKALLNAKRRLVESLDWLRREGEYND